jgi:nitrilase
VGDVVRVAAAQAASVWLDPEATTTKTVELLEQAARERVELVVFPESFLSGYPFWVMLGGGGRGARRAGVAADRGRRA